MAEARVSVDLDEFNCSICLDLLADPVSVPCGHNFCKSCINRQWDEEVLNRVYSCPLCKQHFSPRPILGRNIMLAEMVEKLKKTRVSERTLAGPEDVECDVCIGNKHKAVKSCLVCVASYCQVHFEMHNELNPENTHKVIESRYSLKDRICSVHKKPKDVICCHEEELYCPECVVKSCAYHSTTTVTNKRQEEQFQIEHIQTDVLQRTQAVENSIKDLKKAVNTIKTSAKTTLDQTEKMFAELIRSAERKRSEIRKIIKATEEAEVHRAEKILHGLKQEVTELKERDKKLVQLSNLEDDFLFVKTSKSLFNLSTFSDAPKFTVNLTPFKEIQNSVSELEIKCKEFCMSGLSPSSTAAVNRCHMIQASVPILREDFHQRLWVSDDSSVKLFGKIEKVHECIPEWTEVKHVTQPHPAFRHATHSYLQVRVDAPDSPQAGVIEVQVLVPSKNLRIPLSVKSTDTAATLIKKCLEQRPDLGETLNLAYNGKPVSPCKILGELGVKSGAMFLTYH